MRNFLTLAVILFTTSLLAQTPPPLILNRNAPEIHAYFSPKGGCEEAVVQQINRAQKTILVQAYSFTNKEIAGALVKAKKRGVKIEVILDKSQRTEQYSAADFVAHAGIRTLIDAKHQIAHNKIIIIDYETVITGSFNFSKAIAVDEKTVQQAAVEDEDLKPLWDNLGGTMWKRDSGMPWQS
jgi:phosphatidylserine/phosphatidylglycerophosphate/cardiolipin synthase-like enzyme